MIQLCSPRQTAEQRSVNPWQIKQSQLLHQQAVIIRERVHSHQLIQNLGQRSTHHLAVPEIINLIRRQCLEASGVHHLRCLLQCQVAFGNLSSNQLHGQRMPVNRVCQCNKRFDIRFLLQRLMRVVREQPCQIGSLHLLQIHGRAQTFRQLLPGNQQHLPADIKQ